MIRRVGLPSLGSPATAELDDGGRGTGVDKERGVAAAEAFAANVVTEGASQVGEEPIAGGWLAGQCQDEDVTMSGA